MIAVDAVYKELQGLVNQASPRTMRQRELTLSHGDYLAQEVLAAMDHPSFSQSAMDGYAMAYVPQFTGYVEVGTVAAGDRPDQLVPGAGECVRIMTGAALPSSTDTVVMVEKATCTAEGLIQVPGDTLLGQHVRLQGSNVASGDVIAAAGSRLTSQLVAALLSQGISQVKVRDRPRLAVIATGSEILPAGTAPEAGSVFNSNSPTLAMMLANCADVTDFGILKDEPDHLATAMAAMTSYDVIVFSGGVSMGDFDFVPVCAQRAGFREIFHKVRMKPGKPLWLGRHDQGCIFFGLPGNPVSAWVGARLFIEPLLRGLCRGVFSPPGWVKVPVTASLINRSERVTFIGARMAGSPLEVTPIKTTGSGDLIGFAPSQTLIRLDAGQEVKPGEPVAVLWPDLDCGTW